MLVREKDGFYVGQVREFPSHIALELIAAGRAENPFNEIEDAPEERVAAPAAIKPKPQPGRRGNRG